VTNRCGVLEQDWPNYGGQSITGTDDLTLNGLRVDPGSGLPWTFPLEGGYTYYWHYGGGFSEGAYADPTPAGAYWGPLLGPYSMTNNGTRDLAVQPFSGSYCTAKVPWSTQLGIGHAVNVNGVETRHMVEVGAETTNNIYATGEPIGAPPQVGHHHEVAVPGITSLYWSVWGGSQLFHFSPAFILAPGASATIQMQPVMTRFGANFGASPDSGRPRYVNRLCMGFFSLRRGLETP
jgi:hypothetical protein